MSPTHIYTTPGPHNVTLQVFNSCGVTTTSLLAPLNVANLAGEADAIALYPNPAQSSLNIEAKGNTTISEFKIYNALGGLVYNFAPDGIRKKLVVDVSGYAAGTYTVVVNTNAGSLSRTFRVTK